MNRNSSVETEEPEPVTPDISQLDQPTALNRSQNGITSNPESRHNERRSSFTDKYSKQAIQDSAFDDDSGALGKRNRQSQGREAAGSERRRRGDASDTASYGYKDGMENGVLDRYGFRRNTSLRSQRVFGEESRNATTTSEKAKSDASRRTRDSSKDIEADEDGANEHTLRRSSRVVRKVPTLIEESYREEIFVPKRPSFRSNPVYRDARSSPSLRYSLRRQSNQPHYNVDDESDPEQDFSGASTDEEDGPDQRRSLMRKISPQRPVHYSLRSRAGYSPSQDNAPTAHDSLPARKKRRFNGTGSYRRENESDLRYRKKEYDLRERSGKPNYVFNLPPEEVNQNLAKNIRKGDSINSSYIARHAFNSVAARGRLGSSGRRYSDVSDSDEDRTKASRGAKYHTGGGGDHGRPLPMNFHELEGSRRPSYLNSKSEADAVIIPKNITFDNVGGLDHHVKSLKEMVMLPLLYPELYEKFNITPPRGVIFHGSPGTGKTLVARALASSCSSENQKIAFFMRKGADCLSKWVGEAERQLRLLFEEARAWQPSIIFFDEIDGLAPIRSSKSEQVHSSVVSTLLALMDGLDSRGQVVVIGATNRLDAIDPALRRPGRFDREFYFPLPDRQARKVIIKLQTDHWSPPLESSLLEKLVDMSNGYSGADLKALCTEAALRAIASRYPQIYSSNEKLLLDLDSIKVTEEHFLQCAREIVPSIQRSAANVPKPLSTDLALLLSAQYDQLLSSLFDHLPDYRVKESSIKDKSKGVGNSLERRYTAISLQEPFTLKVYHPRLLISGSEGQGQQDVGKAILNALEGYYVQSVDSATLMADVLRSPEATCLQMFMEVKRQKPSVIYIPHIETWAAAMPESLKANFEDLLYDLDAEEPILLLATSNCKFSDLPFHIQSWFNTGSLGNKELRLPNATERLRFFSQLRAELTNERSQWQQHVHEYEDLPKAPPPPPKRLNKDEIQRMWEHDEHVLRELRRELRHMTEEVAKDRKYKPFCRPVDLVENPDYTEVIKEPMDLSTIMQNINRHQYLSVEDWMRDIHLIKANAIEYNGDDSDLAFRAYSLVDECESLVHYLGEDLLRELRTTTPRRSGAIKNKKMPIYLQEDTPQRLSRRLRHLSPDVPVRSPSVQQDGEQQASEQNGLEQNGSKLGDSLGQEILANTLAEVEAIEAKATLETADTVEAETATEENSGGSNGERSEEIIETGDGQTSPILDIEPKSSENNLDPKPIRVTYDESKLQFLLQGLVKATENFNVKQLQQSKSRIAYWIWQFRDETNRDILFAKLCDEFKLPESGCSLPLMFKD